MHLGHAPDPDSPNYLKNNGPKGSFYQIGVMDFHKKRQIKKHIKTLWDTIMGKLDDSVFHLSELNIGSDSDSDMDLGDVKEGIKGINGEGTTTTSVAEEISVLMMDEENPKNAPKYLEYKQRLK